MPTLKVAAFQAPLLPAGSMVAIELIGAALVQCEEAGMKILCCPEAVLGGLADDHESPAEIAHSIEDLERMLERLVSDVTLIVGFTERGPSETWFNSAAVVERGRVRGIYRKRHPAMRKSVYSPGTESPIFTAHGVSFGIVICSDANYPELSHDYPKRGAALLFMPLNNRLRPEVAEAWRARTRQNLIDRAVENAVPVVAADVAGRDGERMSYGASAIVSANGTVVAVAEPFTEGLIIGQIDCL